MTSRELLISGAQELGLSLSGEQVDKLFLYLAELAKWNRKINLTAITSERDAVIKHLLDSLSYLKGMERGPDGRLLDMGSGAGLPALPLLVTRPELSATLVESVKKKCSFLRHAIRILGLDRAEVLDMRMSEVPANYENMHSFVTARAFADMASALSAGARFLGTGGLMVLSRGPEETIAESAVIREGFVIKERIAFALPHSDNKRALWVFKKQNL